MFNQLIIGAVVRGLITAVSGIVVGRGYVSGDEFQTIAASLTGLGSLAWSIYSRTTNKQIADTAALPSVDIVRKTTGQIIKDVSNSDSAR